MSTFSHASFNSQLKRLYTCLCRRFIAFVFGLALPSSSAMSRPGSLLFPVRDDRPLQTGYRHYEPTSEVSEYYVAGRDTGVLQWHGHRR